MSAGSVPRLAAALRAAGARPPARPLTQARRPRTDRDGPALGVAPEPPHAPPRSVALGAGLEAEIEPPRCRGPPPRQPPARHPTPRRLAPGQTPASPESRRDAAPGQDKRHGRVARSPADVHLLPVRGLPDNADRYLSSLTSRLGRDGLEPAEALLATHRASPDGSITRMLSALSEAFQRALDACRERSDRAFSAAPGRMGHSASHGLPAGWRPPRRQRRPEALLELISRREQLIEIPPSRGHAADGQGSIARTP